MTTSGSMPTARRSTGRLATKRSQLLRRGHEFLALPTLASRYGAGGSDALRRSLELTGYSSCTLRKGLSSFAVKVLQQVDKTHPSKLDDLSGIADSARQNVEQVETTLTTIDDQPIDIAWVT